MSEKIGEPAAIHLKEELEMIEGAGTAFSHEAVQSGGMTPVFFGSAMNNFGVQLLLDHFLAHASPPRPRLCNGTEISPAHPSFSGFIFKIQANMDPKHRDRLAFVRVCSGRFERDMSVVHTRTGKRIRLSNSQKLFARERETIDEAFAGDVIGIVGQSDFAIGDTLSEDPQIEFKEIPRFTPECFAWIHGAATAQYKRFREGLDQLLQEGVVQALYVKDSGQRVPLLAAVGPLQFEVVQYRLESEYGAESRIEHASWKIARWAEPSISLEQLEASLLPTGARIANDARGKLLLLFQNEWSLSYYEEKNPSIKLSHLPWTD